MRSPKCQMDQNNLARVFGPTIVGHGTSEPCTMTIIKDVNTQPKVVGRLLSLPEEYWKHLLANPNTQAMSSTNETERQGDGCGRFFEPLTSPELSIYLKTAGRRKVMNLGSAFSSSLQTKI
ncbi:rac GTPase-activating protein 1-like [Thalassophryne amazonica]|uniref:rac GTPase-activating protein 1-like n=1 Tax=Thalassophryne amazonica TaxID=390379 RepID=UPI0014708BC3|nr:rac GTPase-activating protein 1-like [Thalassophryne amazonica]